MDVNCEILRTLYVKANGDIPCHDDYGERKSLSPLLMARDHDFDINDVFGNENYRNIRQSLAAGSEPWPGVCENCAFLRRDQAFHDSLSQRRIANLQIETSLACSLRCPGCSRITQWKDRPGPRALSLEKFTQLLQSLVTNGYELDELEYCGQGEPLSHPHFDSFVKIGRSLFPHTHQRLITNGNYDFHTSLKDQWLDEIIVSCDGVTQKAYEQYRRGGSVDLALRFMRDAAEAKRRLCKALIWKYILFEYNDSDEEIAKAQDMAQTLGVDNLLFVFTHSAGKSQRYRPDNGFELPILYPNVSLQATPAMQRFVTPVELQDQWAQRSILDVLPWRKKAKVLCTIDVMEVFQAQFLRLRGWALAHQQITEIVFEAPGVERFSAKLGFRREDVQAVWSDYNTSHSGFIAHIKLKGALPITFELSATIFGRRGVLQKQMFRYVSRNQEQN